jgi:hypothetical protein
MYEHKSILHLTAAVDEVFVAHILNERPQSSVLRAMILERAPVEIDCRWSV